MAAVVVSVEMAGEAALQAARMYECRSRRNRSRRHTARIRRQARHRRIRRRVSMCRCYRSLVGMAGLLRA